MKHVLSEAEQSIVGIVLNDPKCYIEAGLRPEHFFDPKIKLVWSALGTLLTNEPDGPFDAVSVGDLLERQGQLKQCGGYDYISSLVLDAPGHKHVGPIAEVIRNAWLIRQCLLLGGSVKREVSAGSTGQEILTSLSDSLSKLETSIDARSLPTLEEALEAETKSLDKDLADIEAGKTVLRGLPAGLGIEAVVPGGIPIDKVTTIFGEAGNFKTTLKNNIVWNIAHSGIGSILDLSYEDSNDLTVQRFIAQQTGLSYGKVASRDISKSDLEKVKKVGAEARKAAGRVILGSDIPPDIDEIIRVARNYKRTRGLCAVVIDYTQLIDNTKEGIDRVVKAVQHSARRDKLAWILVSQVKQDVDQRAADRTRDNRPRISDMIGSSAFRFASKLSIGVYRPYLYEPVPKRSSIYHKLYENHPDGKRYYPKVLELWILKNVLGEPNVCLLCLVDESTGKMLPMPKQMKAMIG